MAAQAQKMDETLETRANLATREAKLLTELGTALKKYENQIPTRTATLLGEVYSLGVVDAQTLIRDAELCRNLLGCIERWNK